MSAGAAWLRALLNDREPSERVGLRRVHDGRYAFGHRRGKLVTAWSVQPFGRAVDLRHVLARIGGGVVNRYYAERRATLRAVLASGDEWELVMIPEPVPVPLGSFREEKARTK